MSVNTTAGFSIVTYTGTGQIGTFPHGLGVHRMGNRGSMHDTNTTDWDCYHVGIGQRVIKLDQDGGHHFPKALLILPEQTQQIHYLLLEVVGKTTL